MKKFFTLMTAFAALMAPMALQASDLVIQTNKNSGVVIEQDGQFSQLNQSIGFTSANTRVCLGEVDFGTNGDKYFATSILLGNGWNLDGWAILHAGDSFETSEPFTQMGLNETGGYEHYQYFGANMAYDAVDPSELSGGGPAMEGITFIKPTGKKKVWLTFVGGAGNIRAVTFYDHALLPTDFVSNEGDWDYGIRLLNPNEKPGYELISTKVYSVDSEPLVPTGEGTDFPDTRIDTSANGQNAWGWTHEGFIADYGTINFENGKYKQIILYLTHGTEKIDDYLEFYIDEVTESNKIVAFWTGLNLELHGPYPYAKNLPNITGQHRVIIKWRGGSTNLQAVEFCEQELWPQHIECGIVLEDVEPSADAFHFTFEGCPEGQGDPWGYELKARGQYEAAGNIGYTGNGTVIDFYGDGDGVDFGEGGWKRIIVNHSSEPAWLGDIDVANFSFYIDLDPDFIYTGEDWSQNLPAILEGHEPIAVVRMQGTGAWSVRKRTAGEFLVNVTGKHELFMVYNTPIDNTAANVWDIWLDPNSGAPQLTTGDVTGDNIVDVEDVNAVINLILKVTNADDYPGNADVTGDGIVDVEDVNSIINIILKID